ncbi:MbnP family protein [Niabella aurantiaca]|uniref:MbnP family protein n=1 Tax=Niabella aurantiaca TaxID=379900 RepID=UPI0003A6586F|nr:MbnP family protein [Niabella aurantiaca]
MKRLYSFYTALFAAILLLASCSKDPVEPSYDQNALAPLSVEFDNIVGGQKLVLNTGAYTNALGQEYNIQLLQYFISNIQVGKADGTTYTVNPDSSYFLIRQDEPGTRFAHVRVPEGNYTSLTFTLGVDSLRSTMEVGKRTGVLDPGAGSGMYWGWNSGYIFFKMEGISPQAPSDPTGQHKFRYHIGGFGGYSTPTINNIKTIRIDLTSRGIAQVRKDRSANIHLMADISKVLSGSTNVSFAANPQVMFIDYSVNIANNYAGMFVHDHTEN